METKTIVYYHIERSKFELNHFWYSIENYYLTKEGYVPCHVYDEHGTEEFPIDSFTLGTYKDFCVQFEDSEVFADIADAIKQLKSNMDIEYKSACFNLLKAYTNGRYQINQGLLQSSLDNNVM
jgi:hypothetical protein